MSNHIDVEPDFRKERYFFLKSKARLDLLNVDEALEEIPFLIQDAGECAALANEIKDTAKSELSLAEAEEAERLRGIQINGKYPAEQAILSKIPLCTQVQQKQSQLSQARLDASLWATVVNSLMTKSSAIRTAADLINSGYLTTDYIYKKRRKEIREVQVRANV